MFYGLFEGYEELYDALNKSAAEKAMKFREQANYRAHFDLFGDSVRAYRETQEAYGNAPRAQTAGYEELMLAAYRFMKFLRKNCNCSISQSRGARPVVTALAEVESILDEPLEHCVPMYMEADALETLSFSIFKALKDKGEIKYCKYCKQFMEAACKKHKEPTSVEDMHYCDGCHGFLTYPCDVHKPALKRTM